MSYVRARLAFALLAVLIFGVVGCSDEPLQSRPDPNITTSKAEGCVPEGTLCTVVLTYPLGGVDSVELRGDFAPDGWDVGIAMQVDGANWRTELALPQGQALHYKFVLNGTDWVTDPNNPNIEGDGVGGENSVVTADCGFEICPAEEPPPPLPGTFDWRSAVLYFVFVDRFNNGDPSNDFVVPGVETPSNYQGGDYAGVTAKIREGYFGQLGVNALWLTVPMDNPNTPGAGSDGHQHTAYHGYWPSDLDNTEEHFGSIEELQELVDEAHARGIKVLFDYAMNHVHSDAPVYAQHPEWFWPLDYNGGTCVCGGGCDWNDDYEQKRCWFTDYLPDWNFQNDQARAFSVNNAIEWIERTGADGYRLDAVKHIETQWLLDLRARVASEIEPNTGEHFYMVGETFESGDREILKRYVGSDRLDGQFDFPLRAVLVETMLRRSGTMYDLDAFLATNDGYYPGVMSTFIGNHDIARVIHTAEDQPWGAWDNGDPWNDPPPLPVSASPFERLAVAFTFLMTTQGVPLIYYGDEVGLAGAGDPDNRRFMQWDGLTDNQNMLRDHIGKLGAIRRDHPALWRGVRSTLSVANDTYAYSLSDEEETVFVALNRGDVAATVSGMPDKGRDLLTGVTVEGPDLNLPPRSAMVVVRE
jgi:glycosidase